MVSIPDSRLNTLSDLSQSEKVLPATIEFVDIAGLVKGASKGEGLGNQFLSNIRETTAIVHMVRCFEDPNIIHVDGKVNPLDDIEVINLELILSDLEYVQKLVQTYKKKIKANDKDDKLRLQLFEEMETLLLANKPLRMQTLNDDASRVLKGFSFITQKQTIYVANVSEDDCVSGNAHSKAVQDFAQSQGDGFMMISARIEEELADLDDEEAQEFFYLI